MTLYCKNPVQCTSCCNYLLHKCRVGSLAKSGSFSKAALGTLSFPSQTSPIHPITMPSISHTIPRVRIAAAHLGYRPNIILSRHARSFTTSKPACAISGPSQMPTDIIKRMPAQQGLRSRMKNLSRQEIPDDLGLIPQTLIRPPRQALPRLFSADWKRRLKFEWAWTRTRFQNFFTYACYVAAPRLNCMPPGC